MVFRDRIEAGRKLAGRLAQYANKPNVLVLGIPRGGVPVAFEIAESLNAPLDVFIVRKLGVPWQPELAFGAIASGNACVFDREMIDGADISEAQVKEVTAREKQELARRERTYRGGAGPLHLEGRTVILVDDGIATGSSMQVAIHALRQMKPAEIVVAVPVAPLSSYRRLKTEADEIVSVQVPEAFYAIGEFYEDFSEVSDEEVKRLLRVASRTAVQNSF